MDTRLPLLSGETIVPFAKVRSDVPVTTLFIDLCAMFDDPTTPVFGVAIVANRSITLAGIVDNLVRLIISAVVEFPRTDLIFLSAGWDIREGGVHVCRVAAMRDLVSAVTSSSPVFDVVDVSILEGDRLLGRHDAIALCADPAGRTVVLRALRERLDGCARDGAVPGLAWYNTSRTSEAHAEDRQAMDVPYGFGVDSAVGRGLILDTYSDSDSPGPVVAVYNSADTVFQHERPSFLTAHPFRRSVAMSDRTTHDGAFIVVSPRNAAFYSVVYCISIFEGRTHTPVYVYSSDTDAVSAALVRASAERRVSTRTGETVPSGVKLFASLLVCREVVPPWLPSVHVTMHQVLDALTAMDPSLGPLVGDAFLSALYVSSHSKDPVLPDTWTRFRIVAASSFVKQCKHVLLPSYATVYHLLMRAVAHGDDFWEAVMYSTGDSRDHDTWSTRFEVLRRFLDVGERDWERIITEVSVEVAETRYPDVARLLAQVVAIFQKHDPDHYVSAVSHRLRDIPCAAFVRGWTASLPTIVSAADKAYLRDILRSLAIAYNPSGHFRTLANSVGWVWAAVVAPSSGGVRSDTYLHPVPWDDSVRDEERVVRDRFAVQSEAMRSSFRDAADAVEPPRDYAGGGDMSSSGAGHAGGPVPAAPGPYDLSDDELRAIRAEFNQV